MRRQIIEFIEREKIIAIVRGVSADKCFKVAEALYAGGVRLMEVTFDQKDSQSFHTTADIIYNLQNIYGGRMLVGAGTVTTVELVELAAKAGAKYIISPDVNANVIFKTLELGLVSIPGALSPSEIMAAHNAGADFIKIFPVASMGPDYIKAIRSPISHVKMLAVGGINENNLADYMKMGIAGAGIGGNLANKAWIDSGEYDKITETAKLLTAIAGSF